MASATLARPAGLPSGVSIVVPLAALLEGPFFGELAGGSASACGDASATTPKSNAALALRCVAAICRHMPVGNLFSEKLIIERLSLSRLGLLQGSTS
jgi:hypothetical protein